MMLSSMLLAAPSASAAERCDKTTSGPRYAAWVEKSERRSSLVRCDRRAGTTTVVRRGKLSAGRGTELVHASAGGRRLAWTERHITRSGASLTLRTADVLTMNVRQRRVLRRGASARTVDAAVRVNPWDDVVWSVGSGDNARLWSRRAGGKVVSRGNGWARVGKIFGDYTAVFPPGKKFRLRHDIVRNGCPWRPSATVMTSTERVIVSEISATFAEPGGEVEGIADWFVCDRETGKQTTVNSSFFSDPSYDDHDAVGVEAIAGHRVLLAITKGNGKYYSPMILHLFDARAGAMVRTVTVGEWLRDRAVLADDGSFAWISEEEPFVNAPQAVWLARPGADPIVLDRGTVAGLALSGRTLTWTIGGEARSYPLP